MILQGYFCVKLMNKEPSPPPPPPPPHRRPPLVTGQQATATRLEKMLPAEIDDVIRSLASWTNGALSAVTRHPLLTPDLPLIAPHVPLRRPHAPYDVEVIERAPLSFCRDRRDRHLLVMPEQTARHPRWPATRSTCRGPPRPDHHALGLLAAAWRIPEPLSPTERRAHPAHSAHLSAALGKVATTINLLDPLSAGQR